MEGEAATVSGLDPVACRVLGSLIEKERATPQNYPLTLNSLRLACNQSTNRDPVVDYDDHTVETSLGDLREHRLIRIVYSQSNRAAKYRHVLDEALHLGDDELAVLCVLLVRGPQTAGEIKGRSDRLFAFADLAAVNQTLDRLIARDAGALVMRLDRQPGQKDVRYAQLLGPTDPSRRSEPVPPSVVAVPDQPAAAPGAPFSIATPADEDLAARVDDLERQLAELRAEFDALRAEFD